MSGERRRSGLRVEATSDVSHETVPCLRVYGVQRVAARALRLGTIDMRASAGRTVLEGVVRGGIHILGASGSGTSTLGAAVAAAIDGVHLDTDSYYWAPSEPPFTLKRPPPERVQRIQADISQAERWVLSGSLCNWGEALVDSFGLVVFLHLEHDERMRRLRAREAERYGKRIRPDGDLWDHHLEFMRWADSYDIAAPPIRSRALHEEWLARLPCPVLRLDSSEPVAGLVERVCAYAHG